MLPKGNCPTYTEQKHELEIAHYPPSSHLSDLKEFITKNYKTLQGVLQTMFCHVFEKIWCRWISWFVSDALLQERTLTHSESHPPDIVLSDQPGQRREVHGTEGSDACAGLILAIQSLPSPIQQLPVSILRRDRVRLEEYTKTAIELVKTLQKKKSGKTYH